MILGLLVFHKKSFEGFDTFDLSDLEYESRSFLFTNFVGIHPMSLPPKYGNTRPFGIAEEVV
ncbi:hypothetical protein CI610_03207 [invertebrate metagenome]|uniref:Uncharacterized protein n=1 Tax=invertebrate metagenome TaxID=1711999 RepID=A0A2H9T3Q7_9ZZZZ